MKTIEVTVAIENLDTFNAKFAEINRKFEKKGFPVLVATEHEFDSSNEEYSDYIKNNSDVMKFFTISSSWDGMNLADESCDFQGTVNFVDMTDDSSRIVTCENEEVAKILRSEKMVCDCCKKNMTRGKYLAFLKSGKEVNRENVIILGRNCAKNYFPFNVDLYLSGLEFVYNDLIEEYDFDTSFRRHRETHVNTAWLAFCVGKVTKDYTIYNKADPESCARSTREDVTDYLNDVSYDYGRKKFRDDYADIAVSDFEEVREWLITTYQNPIYNEFNMNIHSVLFDAENNLRSEINKKYLGIAVYAFVGARRNVDKIKARELEHKDEMKSEWIGTKGDKFEMELVFVKSIWFESQFGYSAFHFFKDENGNTFKWSSAKDLMVKEGSAERCLAQGEKIKLKGSIKDHSEYNGVKQTVITRCKIVA